jgi:hypothetical protein
MVNDVFPWLGEKPINEITAPDVLGVLRRIDERGARYTAHRVPAARSAKHSGTPSPQGAQSATHAPI